MHKHYTHARQSDESQAKKEAFRTGKTNTEKIEHSQRARDVIFLKLLIENYNTFICSIYINDFR